jgi:hypothetical protein
LNEIQLAVNVVHRLVIDVHTQMCYTSLQGGMAHFITRRLIMHLTNSKDFYSTGMQYLEWYDSLRNDQKQFIISLRYSIAPSTATNEYLEEMVREMCDLLDTAEQEKSKLEDQTDDVVTVFRKDKEKKYTGKEVLDIITKTIGA